MIGTSLVAGAHGHGSTAGMGMVLGLPAYPALEKLSLSGGTAAAGPGSASAEQGQSTSTHVKTILINAYYEAPRDVELSAYHRAKRCARARNLHFAQFLRRVGYLLLIIHSFIYSIKPIANSPLLQPWGKIDAPLSFARPFGGL